MLKNNEHATDYTALHFYKEKIARYNEVYQTPQNLYPSASLEMSNHHDD
jgi:hypothetical protein